MNQYQTKIFENLKTIVEQEQNSMKKATQILIKAQQEKQSIFIFGASHAGLLSQEVFYRAGGLININPIFADSILVNVSPISTTTKMEQLEGYGKIIFETSKMKENDVLILHSVSGRNPVVIEMALEARKKDITVIAITNVDYSKNVISRHSSGKNLYQIADVVINTHGELGDAVCTLPNGKQKVGPASTITSCFIMNSIITEVAFELAEMNPELVPVLYSANLDNTQELNRELIEAYKDTIHYEF